MRYLLLGSQVISGSLVVVSGLYLSKDAVKAINNGPETVFAGLVGLLLSSLGIIGGCGFALIGLALIVS
jgi:hypothetical protein